MDNNQNFGQQPANNNVQPQPQQQGNMMQNNPFGQQQGQGANPFGQPAGPKKPMDAKMLSLISLICSGVGFIMVIFGTIFTCTCSAKRPFEIETAGEFSLSPIYILTIFGILIAVGGIVVAIMAMKNKTVDANAKKLSMVSLIVGIAAAVFGLLPLVTICGYNCSLNGQSDQQIEDLGNSLDDILNDLY